MRFLAIFIAFYMMLPMAAQSKLRIGVFDIQKAVREVDEGRQIIEQLKDEFKNKQGSLNKMRQEIESLTKAYKESEMLYTAETKAKKQQELQKKMIAFQTTGQKMQMGIDQKQAKFLAAILNKMKSIIGSFAQKKGFDLILIKESVLYSKSASDVTNELIRTYNKKFKVSKKKK